MKTKDINKFLEKLSKAPDGHLDKQIANQMKNLIGKPKSEIKTGVMKAIDYSVRGALVSDFGMRLLNILHEVYLDGKSSDFNDENCPWRKN